MRTKTIDALQAIFAPTPGNATGVGAQSLLDLRVSRVIPFNRVGRVESLLYLLNVLNDTAEERLNSVIFH